MWWAYVGHVLKGIGWMFRFLKIEFGRMLENNRCRPLVCIDPILRGYFEILNENQSHWFQKRKKKLSDIHDDLEYAPFMESNADALQR